MSTVKINELNIEYTIQGQGHPVVLMHGWQQNISMMEPIAKHLSENFQVVNFDFPGHGQSDDPMCPWGVIEYTQWFAELMQVLKIENPILIGHSFGCRVAIRYCVQYPVCKMILTGAAGIRPKRHLDYYLRTYSFKAAKQIIKIPGLKQYEENLKKHFGSTDYKNVTGVMRDTFVKVVNDDISDLLEQVKIPVLLVWGDKDEMTPLWMGKMMEAKMQDAGLAIFEGEDHFAYFHQMKRFNTVLDVFLKSEGKL